MIREVLAFTVGAALATGFFYAMEADYRHELEIAQMKLVQEKLRRETLMTDPTKPISSSRTRLAQCFA